MKKFTAMLWVVCLLLSPLSVAPLVRAEPDTFAHLYAGAGKAGLYRLSLPPEAGDVYELSAHEGWLLLTGSDPQDSDVVRLTLLDIQHGSAVGTVSLAASQWDGIEVGFLQDGRIYALTPAHLYLYNNHLQQTASFPLPTGDSLYTCLDPSGERLWYINDAFNTIMGKALWGGEDIVLSLAHDGTWEFAGFLGQYGQELSFAFDDGRGNRRLFRYDVAAAQLRQAGTLAPGFYPLPGQDRMHSIPEGMALFSAQGNTHELIAIDSWQANESLLDARDDLLLSFLWDGDGMVRVYDLAGGVIVNGLVRDAGGIGSWYAGALMPAIGCAALLDIHEELDTQGLFLWAYAANAHPVTAGMRTTSLEGLQADNDALALSIARKYGVSVFIRKEGAAFSDSVYNGVPEYNEMQTARALGTLEEFLHALPPGLLREVLVPPYERLAFYLPSSIKQIGEEGIVAPAGFASSGGMIRYIALSVARWGMEANLAHEMMHVLEDRLQTLPATGQDKSPLERFTDLSPLTYARGGYAYSYEDVDSARPGADNYTALGSRRELPIYYIDSYSRTFPLEDRARLFEHLFVSRESLPPAFESPHVMQKALYLCYLLREAFPCVSALPTAPWELLLPGEDTDWDAVFARISHRLPPLPAHAIMAYRNAHSH